MTYDAPGRLKTLTMGNGETVSRLYNVWTTQGGRLQSITATVGQTTLQNLSYTYDNVGNILTINDAIANENLSFDYDELNRLFEVTGAYSDAPLQEGEPPTKYQYDSITGNLLVANGNELTYDAETHPTTPWLPAPAGELTDTMPMAI
jgi:hypothetical protein